MKRTVSLKNSDFFLKHNFECLLKRFNYQSVYNHGKPECEVSVFEIPFIFCYKYHMKNGEACFKDIVLLEVIRVIR